MPEITEADLAESELRPTSMHSLLDVFPANQVDLLSIIFSKIKNGTRFFLGNGHTRSLQPHMQVCDPLFRTEHPHSDSRSVAPSQQPWHQ